MYNNNSFNYIRSSKKKQIYYHLFNVGNRKVLHIKLYNSFRNFVADFSTHAERINISVFKMQTGGSRKNNVFIFLCLAARFITNYNTYHVVMYG